MESMSASKDSLLVRIWNYLRGRSVMAGQHGETKPTSSSQWDEMWKPNYWDQIKQPRDND
jgi:hypothetical protein